MGIEADIGRVIDQRYRLEKPIGRGGMSVVWQAEHLALAAPVALKLGTFVASNEVEAESRIARFRREARSLARIRSPHVVQVLDFGIDKHQPFLVMEYLKGETLARRLKRVGTIAPEELHFLLMEVADALVRAHDEQLVHRDLKPSNIVLTEWGDGLLAKLLDFGIVKRLGHRSNDTAQTGPGMLVGTPYYMSPEQIRSASDVDSRSDLWGLAVIAYECLCGERAFPGRTTMDVIEKIVSGSSPIPSDVMPELQPFDDWFTKALHSDPNRRFQSAFALVEGFHGALKTANPATEAPSPDPDTMPLAVINLDQIDDVVRDTDRVSLVSELGPRTNLPEVHLSFHGRAQEKRACVDAFQGEHRLVTLTGPGGSGKSRLAVEIARDLLNHFEGGVWFINLAPCRDQAALMRSFGRVLGIPIEQSARSDTLESVIDARGPLLLVFDNAEHLLDDCADYVIKLLKGAPHCHFLITTRSPLNIEDEATIDIGPLPTPIGVELFMTRARQVDPRSVAGSTALERVTDLVERLDGLSLAIELAAARLRTMSLEQLHDRLSLRFQLLQSDRRDQDARQRTMWSAIDWSWRLLNPTERWVLAQCSVFRGGFSDTSANAIIDLRGLDVAPWIDEPLRRLVDQSLLMVELTDGDNRRYRLLHSIREYAAEKLTRADEVLGAGGRSLTGPQAYRDLALRHAGFFAEFGDDTILDAVETRSGAHHLKALSQDIENLVQGVEHALEFGLSTMALRPALAACLYMSIHGPYASGAQLAKRVLDSVDQMEPAAWRLLVYQALLLRVSGANEDALRIAQTVVDYGRRVGDGALESMALIEWASVRRKYGMGDEVSAAFNRARDRARRAGDRQREAIALAYLGHSQLDRGETEKAEANLQAALAAIRDIGHRRLEGLVLSAIGDARISYSDLDGARAHYEAGLRVQREVGDRRGEAGHLLGLGALYFRTKKYREAQSCFESALRLGRAVGSESTEVVALGHLGETFWALGNPSEGRRFLEKAIVLGDRSYPAPAAVFRGSLASVLAQSGNIEHARILLDEAESKTTGYEQNRGQILCHRGQVEIVAGRILAAIEALKDAKTISKKLGRSSGFALDSAIEELASKIEAASPSFLSDN